MSRFDQFAATITDKIADLLQMPVLVTDNYRIVVASSRPQWLGKTLSSVEAEPFLVTTTVPLSVDSEAGEIRIYQEKKGEKISPQLAQNVVRMAIDQVLLVETLPDYHVLKDKFLHNLLNGLITDVSVIELHANNLGLDLTPPRAVILIDASDLLNDNGRPNWAIIGDLQTDRRVNSVVKTVVDFFSLPNETICAYMGQGEIAILKATDTKNLEVWADNQASLTASSWANLTALKRASRNLLEVLSNSFKVSFSIGIGRHHPGVTGLARSYQDARVALSLGRRFYGTDCIHCLDELGIAAFAGISDERIKVDLATHILSPLDYEPELIETLITFFKCNCSTAETSTILSIHRNTLYYRLNKITSLTGLDPRNFDEAVQIRLALLLRSPTN